MNTAIFIDGDNIKVNRIKFSKLIKKINNDSNIIIKRVYGDWKKIDINFFWNKYISQFGLEEIQISRLAGKNSTDSKIIVDVMECLYTKPFIEKYILLGCDKDYIPLIKKVLEHNKQFDVYGLKSQTSLSIINSASNYNDIDEFIDPNKNKSKVISDMEHKLNEVLEDDDNVDTDDSETSYHDIAYSILSKYTKVDISISELKRKIRDNDERDVFGREFNKLDIFIKTHYPNDFGTKRKNGSFIIYKK